MENTVKCEVLISKRTLWAPPMDRHFISIMVDQVHDGQYLDGQLSKYAWNQMLVSFKGKFGIGYSLEMLKNHYRAVKKAHAAITTLLEESGFGWDEEKEMVRVDSDQVWDDYIKAHPDFRVWRTKSVAGFDQLCIIFGGGGATGKFSRATQDTELSSKKDDAKKGGKVTDEIPFSNGETLDYGDKETIDLDDDCHDDVEVPNLAKRKPAVLQNSEKTKKTKENYWRRYGGCDSRDGIGNDSNGEKRENSSLPIAVGASPIPIITLEAKCVAAVGGIKDIDTETYMQGLDLLEDEKKAKIFVELPAEKRRDWLLYKLCKSLPKME